MRNLKVVAKSKDRSLSDRSALIAALEAKQEADNLLARQKAGIDRARALVRAAEAAVEEAEAAVVQAREEHADAIAQASADDTALPASGVLAARAAKTTAEDQLEAAKSAHAKLRADLSAYEANAREKNIAIDVEISLILAPFARQLLAKAIALKSQYSPVIGELWAIFQDTPAGKPFDQHFDAHKGQAPLAEVRKEIEIFFETFAKFDRTGVNDPWAQNRLRLRNNAHSEVSFATLSDVP